MKILNNLNPLQCLKENSKATRIPTNPALISKVRFSSAVKL